MAAIDNRRPIPSRGSKWAQRTAAWLAARNVSANAISLASVVFALAGAAAFLWAPSHGAWLYGLALLAIPLRLLANLFDGMVAVEHDRASATGPLYNEVPDRVADVALLAAAGASAAGAAAADGAALVAEWGATAGWVAACAALATAYVRELGRGLGAPADFCGPFAKPQRMAVLAVGAALASIEGWWGGGGEVLFAAVAAIAIGTLFTAARRLFRLGSFLSRAA